MKKVAIHTLGCKVNSYESESMEQLLRASGYDIVPFSEEEKADIYIINTCSVTNIADRKSRQMLHKAKNMNPDSIVIACGCYVQANEEIVNTDDAVDIVVGNNSKINIVEVIEGYLKDHSKNAEVIDLSNNQDYEPLTIQQENLHTRAFIKIQDGCNQFCTYCIIPYTRGRIRSRKLVEIIDEVKGIAQTGVKEVVLTGIHLCSWGKDTGEGDLIGVVEALAKIDGIERIRLGSLEPRIITEENVARMRAIDKLCPHFHLSLQSGCDEVLKRMNRHYTTEAFMDGVRILRKYYDDVALTTDIIVGFPAETDEEFEQTRLFLSQVNFYEMHVFKYSRRAGTIADGMKDQIIEKVKTARSAVLLEMTKEQSGQFRENHIGKSMPVLFEEIVDYKGQQYYSGHTVNYLKVYKKVDEKMGDQLGNQTYEKPSEHTGNQPGNQPGEQTGNQTGEQVCEQVTEENLINQIVDVTIREVEGDICFS